TGQGVHEGRDRAVAGAGDVVVVALDLHDRRDLVVAVAVVGQAVAFQGQRGHGGQVLGREHVPHLPRVDLAALAVGHLLDNAGDLDLQPAGQLQLVLGLHDVGDAALAGLRVHPDHGLV